MTTHTATRARDSEWLRERAEWSRSLAADERSMTLATPTSIHEENALEHEADADRFERIALELEVLEADREAAQNLLAVLHGDGGHHEDRVGHVQACKDAEARHHQRTRRLGALERVAKAADQHLIWESGELLDALALALNDLDALEADR